MANAVQRGCDLPTDFDALNAQVRACVDVGIRDRLQVLREVAARYDVAPTVDALSDLALRGGKRFRALMSVIGFCGMRPRASWQPAIDAGVAIEMLHTYLLVQDDWMDHDTVRRGGPTVHVMLGEQYGGVSVGAASAVLSSDMAWGVAIDTLASTTVSPQRRLDSLRVLCEIHQQVLLGQQIDILADRQDVEVIHELKTASYTVLGPLLIGASLAGVDQAGRRAIERFATPLGVAFQLRDDLLGTFAPSVETGKPLAGDLRRGKRTAVTVAGQSMLDAVGKRAMRRVFGNGNATDRALIGAAAHLERCGVKSAVVARLLELCGQAQRQIRYLPFSPQARLWLKQSIGRMRDSARALEEAG
jgi:geranylgeranyl diphosphate synthase type I